MCGICVDEPYRAAQNPFNIYGCSDVVNTLASFIHILYVHIDAYEYLVFVWSNDNIEYVVVVCYTTIVRRTIIFRFEMMILCKIIVVINHSHRLCWFGWHYLIMKLDAFSSASGVC